MKIIEISLARQYGRTVLTYYYLKKLIEKYKNTSNYVLMINDYTDRYCIINNCINSSMNKIKDIYGYHIKTIFVDLYKNDMNIIDIVNELKSNFNKNDDLTIYIMCDKNESDNPVIIKEYTHDEYIKHYRKEYDINYFRVYDIKANRYLSNNNIYLSPNLDIIDKKTLKCLPKNLYRIDFYTGIHDYL